MRMRVDDLVRWRFAAVGGDDWTVARRRERSRRRKVRVGKRCERSMVGIIGKGGARRTERRGCRTGWCVDV